MTKIRVYEEHRQYDWEVVSKEEIAQMIEDEEIPEENGVFDVPQKTLDAWTKVKEAYEEFQSAMYELEEDYEERKHREKRKKQLEEEEGMYDPITGKTIRK